MEATSTRSTTLGTRPCTTQSSTGSEKRSVGI
ncbi:hypothetical protein ACHAWF_012433 [Thalassiosira exigua]